MYRRLHRCNILSALDNAYTPEVIEAIWENWPAIEAARDSGTMSINVSVKEHATFASLEARRDFNNMIPRASRRTNTAYKIDDLSSIVCDMHKAMEQISQLSLSRLMRYHYEGYTLEEIGEQDGCTKQAILFSLRASYNKMSDWLESPKIPVVDPPYTFEAPTHHRKFSSPEYFIPAQR